MELWQMSAVELARTIRLGQASSREAVQSVLCRMDAVNPKLNAVVRRMDDEALTAAEASDAVRAQARAASAARRAGDGEGQHRSEGSPH